MGKIIKFEREINYGHGLKPSEDENLIRDADIVIDRVGVVIKDRHGSAQRDAGVGEIEDAEVIQ